MDLNTLRIAVTVASFGVFIGIALWAYARGNRGRFERDALIPFEQD